MVHIFFWRFNTKVARDLILAIMSKLSWKRRLVILACLVLVEISTYMGIPSSYFLFTSAKTKTQRLERLPPYHASNGMLVLFLSKLDGTNLLDAEKNVTSYTPITAEPWPHLQ